jgi:hypothetical protein
LKIKYLQDAKAKAKRKQSEAMRWNNRSRFGTARTYEIFNNTLTVMCYDSPSYSFSLDAEQNVTSVDPTGGPRFFIGQRVTHKGYEWTIQSVMYHYKKDSTAVFVFGINAV